jgi:hypothetical protein
MNSPSSSARLVADEHLLATQEAAHEAARTEAVHALEAAAHGVTEDSTAPLVLLAAAAARLATSSIDEGRVANVAEAALAKLRARATPPSLSATEVLRALASVDSTSTSHTPLPALFQALAGATALLAGAEALGLAATDPALAAALERLLAGVERVVNEVVEKTTPTSSRRLGLALLANQHLAAWGAAFPADAPLAKLADALVPTLAAAFRGVALPAAFDEAPVAAASIAREDQAPVSTQGRAASTEPAQPQRIRALAPAELQSLGAILKQALDRDAPLRIEPSLLELTPFFLASSAPDLVFHEDAHDASLVVPSSPLPGTVLRLHLDAVELELLDPSLPEPLLLPIVGEVALEPCRCRTGMTARHFVFEPSDHPAVEAYALLLGDRVALLRA